MKSQTDTVYLTLGSSSTGLYGLAVRVISHHRCSLVRTGDHVGILSCSITQQFSKNDTKRWHLRRDCGAAAFALK